MFVAYVVLFMSTTRLTLARPGDGSAVIFPGETESLRVARKYPSNRPDVVEKEAAKDADVDVDPIEYLSKFGYLEKSLRG